MTELLATGECGQPLPGTPFGCTRPLHRGDPMHTVTLGWPPSPEHPDGFTAPVEWWDVAPAAPATWIGEDGTGAWWCPWCDRETLVMVATGVCTRCGQHVH